MSQDPLDSNKDEPLRNDIRLLGRILGDTVREQEGESVFDIVEQVRKTAVRFARDGDPAARDELAGLLDPCRAIPRRPSSAPSVTSCNWPTLPRTNITSVGVARTIWLVRRRAKAVWFLP
jgi:hypothetical protein